jgi:zinc transport system substrate-binding protein
MVVINLLELLGDRALVNDEIDDGHHHHHHHHHDDEYDEHVWLSLKNAIIFTNAITDALSTLDPELSEVYKENAAHYIERLMALDFEYKQVVSNANGDTLLFADRFPFRYLLHDYNLNFYAAFSGCSAETEASFRTITFLARKVNELNLTSVMITESANRSIAETVISNTAEKNQQILVLDSMQSTNDTDRQRGITYISIMESNLEVLKEALR